MAAKEKQQKKPTPPPQAPPPTMDLLTDFDAPPSITDLPPPSYETNFLKDAPAPPPAFDVMEHQQQPPPQMQQMQMQFPPPPPIDSVLPPPPPLNDILPPPPMPGGDLFDMGMPSATAPMFEDLHTQQHHRQEFHPMPLPPPMEAAPPALDIDESILNALEPAEREAFLEEQRQILEQIEREKSNNEASGATARAMAFDQRSSSAVANVAASYEREGRSSSSRSRTRPSSSSGGSGTMVNLGSSSGSVAVRGSKETQKAIDDGTAVIGQCVSCNNWMQVTEAAELMFCPICQVVCPVEKKGAATTADMEAAAQLAADAELAEMLQKEEYAGAEQRRSRPSGSSRAQSSASASVSDDSKSSWYGWLTGAPATAGPPATRSAQTSGVSSPQRTGGGGGLVSAIADESVGLMGLGGGGGSGSSGARMAEPSKSMFTCVADSMNTAVTQMYTFQSDEEGNVHGVDSHGLLAMPDVSRQRE
jgi:hypothetical protein